MADNNKDFNLRAVINDLIRCLKAASNFKDKSGIDLDKDTLYKEVIDVIKKDASLGSMVLLHDQLSQMINNFERFQMSPGSLLIMDGTPNNIGSTIDKTQRVITLADVFDSAGTQGIDEITIPEGSTIHATLDAQRILLNKGLELLLTNYKFIGEYIESIEVESVHDSNKFDIKFTLKNGRTFVVENITAGSDGVFTVEAISKHIKGTKTNTKLKEIRDKLERAGISPDEVDKLSNMILLYFKEGGDFTKCFFGFKLGLEPNFLTTQDIMFFVTTMFLNFYHTDLLEELGIEKQTYVILGTGKTLEDGKKIAFVNDDEFYLDRTIRQLVEGKLIGGIYHYDVAPLAGNILTISLNLQIEEGGGYILPLIIYSGEIDTEPINPLKLKESKKKFAEIMKAVENAISLVDNVGYNNKIKGYYSPITSKSRIIITNLRGLNPQLISELSGDSIMNEGRANKMKNVINCSTKMLKGIVDLENHVLTYFKNGDHLRLTLNKLKSLNPSPNPNAFIAKFFTYMDSNIKKIIANLSEIITDDDVRTSVSTMVADVEGFVDPIIKKYEEYLKTNCEGVRDKDQKLCEELQKYLDAYQSILTSVARNNELRSEIEEFILSLKSDGDGAGAAASGSGSAAGGGLKSYKKKYISKKINNPQNILIYKKGVVKSGKDVKVGKSSKTIKEVKVSKGKTVKSNKTVKDVKPVKTVKDVKEVKVSKDKTVKDVKPVKTVKDVKEVKVSKGKTVKDVKPAKATKTIKDIKDVKDKAEKKLKIGKEKIMKNILGKDRRVYKITGDRKEYVKYKNELITVKEYIKRVKSNTKTNNKKINGTKKK